MNRILYMVIIALLLVCGALCLATNHYRDNAITYKAQRDKKVSELNWRMPLLLICSSARVMLLRSMQNTRGN